MRRTLGAGLTLALALLSTPAAAQVGTGSVSGRVVGSANQQPLAGAQVTVVGTERGTVTGADGRYTITGVPAGAQRVRATLLGYTEGTAAVTVAAGQAATANLSLQAQAVQLEGIVAVGYGTQRRRDVTGAVTSVQADEITQQPVSRVDQALAGKAPGVEIQTTNNAPGASMRIRIRGGNSLQGNNDPLVVVDGVLGVDLNVINPNDIASIDVLKDASATAIYGARGANGVILVTTKRGTPGRTSIEYSGYYGMQDITRKVELLTAAEHAELINANPNSQLRFDDPAALGEGTDWQDVIFQSAPMQNHQLSLSGGAEGTRYLLSGSFLDQQGVIRTSDFRRATVRLNLDQTINERFRAGTRLSYARSVGHGARVNGGYGTSGGPVTLTALIFSPIVPVYTEDGAYSGPLVAGAQLDNPLAILTERDDVTTRNYLLGNLYGEYDLFRGVTFRSSFGYTMNERLNEQYTSRSLLAALNQGEAIADNDRGTNWLVENTLTMQRDFGESHSFNAVAGLTAEEGRDRSNLAQGRGFPSDLLGYNALDLAEIKTVESSASRSALLSYLGRVNYSYGGKYLLTLSGRADGSSKFARNNKWAFFPSAALAWRVSEEPFMEALEAVSDLKLRASYGKTGSQAIGSYQSLAAYSLGNRYAWGFNFFTNGVRPSRIENPNLKWETTAQYDLGADLALFDNLVSLSADYYYKKTSDLLYSKQLPNHTGYTTQIQNIGSLENRGVELALDLRHSLGPVEWQLGTNLSVNRNKVLDLGGDTEFTQAGANGSLPRFVPAAIVRVGEPVGNFYGYVWDGIFQTAAEAAASGQAGAVPGGMRIRDLNGDGRINEQDRTILGNALADYTFGINGSLGWGGLDLSFVVRGVQGNDIANLGRQGLENPGSQNNQSTAVLDYWRGEGSTNAMTAVGIGAYDAMTSRWIEDGSFVRLQNVTLGYELPEGVRERLNLGRMRLYLSGQNLFTSTDYSWYDPETSSRGGNDLQLGWDDGGYPGTRTVTLGVNVGF